MKTLRLVIFFGLIGTIGFCVDTLILYLLKDMIGLFYARAISFTCSAFITWLLNRNLTFKKHSSGLHNTQELFFYFVLMLIGGGINYGVYSIIIMNSAFALNNPVIGVAVGSICGMFVNLLTSKLILFKHTAFS
jgi:putative flippase GtrA